MKQISKRNTNIINVQKHNLSSKVIKIRPKDTLIPFGEMDMSRPDSINYYKSFKNVPKSPRMRPIQTLGLYGSLDLSRPDSINQQTPNR